MKVKCAHDELVSIKKLIPHPKNRNKHPKEQLIRFAKVLEYQGVRRPVRVSELSGYITAGHALYQTAKLLKWKELPVDYQEYDDESQEIADINADNALALWAQLDLAGINDDIVNLGPDFDVDWLGIKDFVIEPAEKIYMVDEDSMPTDDEVETTVKPGQIWQLGAHRIMCGDSTDRANIDALMNGEKADMVFTDPPYGMNLDANYSTMHKQVEENSTAKAKIGTRGSKWKKVEGDDQPFNPGHIFEFFNNTEEIFLWGGDYYCDKLPIGTFIVWDKNNGNENADAMIGNAYEMAWSKKRHKKVMARIFGRGTFGHDKVKVHPTQKPVQLAEWFFERWGKEAKLIWDGYLGSGSTLIACEKTNRKCYGLEIDPHYCDVIIARWEKFTGSKAILANG